MYTSNLPKELIDHAKICKSKFTDLEYNFSILENNQVILWKNNFNVTISKEMFDELYEEKICA